MRESELKQLVSSIRAPLMIADRYGASLAENSAWGSARQLLGNETALRDLAQKAAGSGKEQTLMSNGLTGLAVPSAGGWVVLQIQEESFQKLREQMEDRAKTSSAYQETLSNFGIQNYIATSDSMIRIFTKAKQVAPYPTTILLLGDTGVGKEVISTFIYRNSDRAGKPFIKINCSAIPEPLMESELFGYEKGAFTGARDKGKMGLFELANHGTILLDEIGDMSLPLQAKLLRTLQENEIMRIGGSQPIKLDVRLIAATSRNIEKMVAEGDFLDALYYRLNVVELRIPPLRERQEDIIPLAEFYLQHFCEKYKLNKEFAPDVRACFLQYGWPGNVRELRNTVENLTVSCMGPQILRVDLPARIAGDLPIAAQVRPQYTETTMKQAVESLQRDLVTEALYKEGSLRKAAAALDMDPTTLSRLVKKLGIT